MLTGHCTLNYHMFNMEKTTSPYCDQCGDRVREDTLHFLGNCHKFSNIRYSIFGFHFIHESQIRDLNIHKILAFVRKTKRYET